MSCKSVSHILVFDEEKKKATKNVWCPKRPKACSSIEMSKISGINLMMRCYDSKRSNVMKNMEPNKKLKSYVINFCGRSYAYFYNWDGSHYLVLIVYGLVELIIETSHLTKDYLIVDIHTHHTCQCSMNAIFICVIVLD